MNTKIAIIIIVFLYFICFHAPRIPEGFWTPGYWGGYNSASAWIGSKPNWVYTIIPNRFVPESK